MEGWVAVMEVAKVVPIGEQPCLPCRRDLCEQCVFGCCCCCLLYLIIVQTAVGWDAVRVMVTMAMGFIDRNRQWGRRGWWRALGWSTWWWAGE